MRNFFLPVSLCVLLLSSCATYHITTESLLEQFAGSKKEQKITLLIAPPFIFFPGVVNGNDLSTITVLDKNNEQQTLYVNKHTGVRITQKDGKRTTFYFNTLLIKDSTITGSKTHFFTAGIKPIYLSNISKIELQK